MRLLAGLTVAFGMLALVEAGLRFQHVQEPIPFFTTRTDALGHDWILTNPKAADEWFPGPEWDDAVRHPRPQVFEAVKPKNTLRIFVFGESAAYGTPFTDNASWPRMLEHELARGLMPPEMGGERPQVINCGIRASTLSLAIPVLDETRAYEPDVYVIYAGHNEFYGPRLPTWFERLRMFKLLQAAQPGATLAGTPGSSGPKVLGIRADFSIPPDDPLRASAATRFKDSLTAFFAAAAPTPVIVVPVYANERDLAPLGSFEAPAHLAAAAEAKALIRSVEHDPSRATPEVAADATRLLAALPGHAGLEHVLGLSALLAGDLASARTHFQASQDLDTTPIRATTAVRNALLDAVHEADPARVSTCDPGPAFRAATADGALDHRIFLDHVHLTLLGGYLLASDLTGCIPHTLSLSFGTSLGNGSRTFDGPWGDEAIVLRSLSVTDADQVAVANNMAHYFRNATVQASPSRERSVAFYQAQAQQFAARVDPAQLRLVDGPPDELHLRIARSLQAPSSEQLLAEVRAAVLSSPGSGPAHAWLATLLLASNSPEAREEALRALLLGVPAAEGRALCRQFGLPERAATVYTMDTQSSLP